MIRDFYCSRFTRIGCEDHNENERARKKNVTLPCSNSFWKELAVLELEQDKPGRGPEGRKGQALALGRKCMHERRCRDETSQGRAWVGCRKGQTPLCFLHVTCFFYMCAPSMVMPRRHGLGGLGISCLTVGFSRRVEGLQALALFFMQSLNSDLRDDLPLSLLQLSTNSAPCVPAVTPGTPDARPGWRAALSHHPDLMGGQWLLCQ